MRFYSFLILVFLAVSCANQVSLTGGNKDETPPKFVLSIPDNGSTNFNSKEIRVEFDELVQIKNSNQIIVSPLIDQKIKYQVNGKSILIKLEEALTDSATYTFNFGKSLVDNNESNALVDFTYTLSTYNELDTLSFGGQTIDAFTKEPIKEILLGLYKQEVFDIDSLKPFYFTYTNDQGLFSIKGIREGSYYLRAIKDDNRDYKLQLNEQFGFSNLPILITEDIDSVQVELSNNRSIRALYEVNQVLLSRPIIVFTKPIIENEFLDSNGVKMDFELANSRDTVFLKTDGFDYDVLHILEGRTDTIYIPKIGKENEKVPTPALSLLSEKVRGNCINLKSSIRIDSVNLTGIHLMKDSIEMATDSIVLGLRNNIRVFFTRPDGLNGARIMVDSASIFHRGVANNAYANPVALVNVDELGQIEFTIKSENTELKSIVQLLDNKGSIVRFKYLNRNTVSFNKLYEGEYSLRIIVDENSNKVWDSAEFETLGQAERVLNFGPYRLEKGWDLLGNVIEL